MVDSKYYSVLHPQFTFNRVVEGDAGCDSGQGFNKRNDIAVFVVPVIELFGR